MIKETRNKVERKEVRDKNHELSTSNYIATIEKCPLMQTLFICCKYTKQCRVNNATKNQEKKEVKEIPKQKQ